MFGVLDTAFLQASASSLVRGYRNVRAAVGLPDGGVRNPPPLQYRPLAVLARPLAGQPGGVTSGAGGGGGGVAWAGAPAGTAGTAPGVVLGSGLGLAPSAGPAAAAAAAPAPAGAPRAGPHPPPGALPAGTALAASLVAAASVGGGGGAGPAGVAGAAPARGRALPPGAWAASAALPQGVLRPTDNDSLAFMPARGPARGPLCRRPHTAVLLRAVGGDRVARALRILNLSALASPPAPPGTQRWRCAWRCAWRATLARPAHNLLAGASCAQREGCPARRPACRARQVLQLAALLRSKQVTSRELTAVFTQRLKRCARARRWPGLRAPRACSPCCGARGARGLLPGVAVAHSFEVSGADGHMSTLSDQSCRVKKIPWLSFSSKASKAKCPVRAQVRRRAGVCGDVHRGARGAAGRAGGPHVRAGAALLLRPRCWVRPQEESREPGERRSARLTCRAEVRLRARATRVVKPCTPGARCVGCAGRMAPKGPGCACASGP